MESTPNKSRVLLAPCDLARFMTRPAKVQLLPGNLSNRRLGTCLTSQACVGVHFRSVASFWAGHGLGHSARPCSHFKARQGILLGSNFSRSARLFLVRAMALDAIRFSVKAAPKSVPFVAESMAAILLLACSRLVQEEDRCQKKGKGEGRGTAFSQILPVGCKK